MKKDDVSTEYEVSSHFRGCEAAKDKIDYCPENEYLTEMVFTCTTVCVECGYSGTAPDCCDPPACDEWETSDDCDDPDTTHMCGKEDDLWEEMDASDWDCSTCRELALRQEEEPILELDSFGSVGFMDFPLYGGREMDLSFVTYIEACVNRVPMVNLEVNLLEDGSSSSRLVGIYSQHQTMDYTADNFGVMEEFELPEQEEFSKTYELDAQMRAYRPWAFRERLVESIERNIDNKDLEVPGVPDTATPQRVGDLYYSADVLAGGALEDEGMECEQTVTQDRSYTLNVLDDIEELEGHEMCDVDDFEGYIDENGITEPLEDFLRDEYNLDPNADISDMSVSSHDIREIRTNIEDSITFDVTELDYDDFSDFDENVEDDLEEQQDILLDLIDEEIIDAGDFEDSIDSNLRDILVDGDYNICGELEPTYEDYDLRSEFNYNNAGDGNVSLTRVPLVVYWENKVEVDLDFEVDVEHDCSEMWTWGNIADLGVKNLAKCLYNWDDCLMNPVSEEDRDYYEAADCGMGPTSELMDTSLKDAARGDKIIDSTVTVYRECELGSDWVSKHDTYACSQGQTYRCGIEPSLDTNDFVEKAELGNTIEIGDEWYVCRDEEGEVPYWESVDCECC